MGGMQYSADVCAQMIVSVLLTEKSRAKNV